jgi:hypothetical protein
VTLNFVCASLVTKVWENFDHSMFLVSSLYEYVRTFRCAVLSTLFSTCHAAMGCGCISASSACMLLHYTFIFKVQEHPEFERRRRRSPCNFDSTALRRSHVSAEPALTLVRSK